MRSILIFLACFILSALTCSAFAQNQINNKGELIGQPWTGSAGITETVSEIMARQGTPENALFRITKVEREIEFPRQMNPKSLPVASWPPQKLSGRGDHPYLPQTIGRSFTGVTGGESPYEPPDTNGSVGPTQIMFAVNGRIKVFDKNGVLGGLNVDTDVFFNSVRNGSSISDPQVRYDPTSGRWFLVAINTTYTNNRVVVAVSSGSTITNSSSFTFYFFVQQSVTPAGNTNCLADYPSLGVDVNALYIGCDMFTTSSFQGVSAFVVRKSSITSGGPIVVSAFRNIATGSSAGPWAARGCDNWDTTATQGFFIGVDILNFGIVQIRRVSTPGGTPTMSANITLTVPTEVYPIATPQNGGTLDALDDRLFAATICKDTITGATTLWCAHNIEVNSSGVGATGGGRNGSRWYSFTNLSGAISLAESGTLFDSAATPKSYTIPSIVMTGQGHVAIGSTVSATNLFAGVAFAGRLRSDSLGTTQSPTFGQAGSGTYGGGRWGDYSATVVDPTDYMTVWSFQEFSNGNWNVRATELKAPLPALPSSLSPNTIAQGATNVNLTLTGTSSSGTGYYDPPASFPNHIAAAFSGTGITVNSVTFTDPTHVTINVSVSGAATAGLRNLTITNPDGQNATGNNLLTVTSGSNPVPTTTSISPTSATAGGSGFTLTVNGTNFVSGSIVRWNGADRTTTFVNATQLTASIPAGDITTAGTATVTVFNPAPGGGTSNGQTFTINNPVPNATTLSPSSATAGGSGFTLTVNGSNFVNGSTVRWNGSSRTTTFVNANQLTASISASDIATAGTASVTVFNASPGGGTSGGLNFTINNPNPAISNLSPSSATAGGSNFALTVNGSNFVSGSVVRVGGSDRTTTFVNAGQLTASILASDIQNAGTLSITVFNPAPGGGTSGSASFQVNNPTPSLTTLSPSSASAGDAGFTLTVNGSNFVNGSVVRWNGSDRGTVFVNSGQLTASISASDIASAGSASVVVFNPTPGGGTSNSLSFTINNPLPSITSISPNPVIAGSGDFTLTVNGSGFVAGSVVRLNGSDRTTTFVSSSSVTATISAADIASAGTAAVTVANAAPGGGVSGPATLDVNNPVPTIDNVVPSSAVTGSGAQDVTINGSNFVATSVAQWNGSDRNTTYVSASQIKISLTASDVSVGAVNTIGVVNPTPGGGASNNVNFTVNNPTPSLTLLTPSNLAAGQGNFTLSLSGSGFVPNSTVQWDGSPRNTTFVDGNSLTADILAADVAVSGTHVVTVENPTPNGGTSNSLTFTVTAGSPTVIKPTSFSVIEGSLFSGGLAQLFNSDNSYVSAFPDSETLSCTYEILATAPATGTNPTVHFDYEGKASRTGLSVEISFKNFTTGDYDVVDSREALLSDDTMGSTVTDGARYIGSGGALNTHIAFYPFNDETPAQDGWLLYLDLTCWQISP